MVIMTCIGLLEALASNGRKKNERVRLKDERGDCLSRRANLKFKTWIIVVVAVTMYDNAFVGWVLGALELEDSGWPWIGVRKSRKKIGKSRQKIIGFFDNKNNQLMICSKVQDYCRGIKRTRAMKLIGLKSKTKINKI